MFTSKLVHKYSKTKTSFIIDKEVEQTKWSTDEWINENMGRGRERWWRSGCGRGSRLRAPGLRDAVQCPPLPAAEPWRSARRSASAIKGKLQELGAYVDEELPNYILVMVANKKSQDQMTEDLFLFLWNNTIRFTVWLHSVLDKLRSVTTDLLVWSLLIPTSLMVTYLQTTPVSVEEMREGTKLQCHLLQFLALDLKKENLEFLQVHRSRKPLMSDRLMMMELQPD